MRLLSTSNHQGIHLATQTQEQHQQMLESDIQKCMILGLSFYQYPKAEQPSQNSTLLKGIHFMLHTLGPSKA